MVSQRRHATGVRLRACALALLMLAAATDALSQAELELPSTAAQRAIVDRIALIQAQDPRSAALISPLTALALLYEESGDFALAVAAIERASDLVRINYGVQSLDQAPLLRQRIAVEVERGNLFGAWNLEQALVALARRHSDDPRTVAILHEIGDKRMDVLERYLGSEFPAEIVFGCYYSDGSAEPVSAVAHTSLFGKCNNGSRGTVIRSVLWEAQMHYSDAIKVGLGNGLYGSSELRELEMDIVRSSFELGHIFQDGRDYALGRESLRRLAAYEAASGAPPLTQIEALIAIADWDVIFSNSRKLQEFALENYERAHERLRTSGEPDAVIEALFAPAAPVVLPTFLPSPFTGDESGDAPLEVAFEVTKEGRAENIKVLGNTVSRTDERRVRQAIMRGRYRPRIVDGRFADAAPVVVRYWLGQPADEAEE